MSRVGKYPVAVPQGVTVDIKDAVLTAKGKLGELSQPIHEDVETTVEDGQIWVKPRKNTKRSWQLWGTTRSVIDGMVRGVSEGFSKVLEISGVGYRAQVQGSNLQLQLGYSHDILFPIPEDVKITCESPTRVVVSGANKQRVGQIAAKIREMRPPEPYKGKGVKYEQETILRKEGKKK